MKMTQDLGKKALVLGATGLTGGHLVALLAAHPNYSEVRVPGRSAPELVHEKVRFQEADLLSDMTSFGSLFEVDEVFVCIGTTRKKTPDKALYRAIDYGIPVNAAKMAAANGVRHFQVISAMGADAESRLMYNKLKGEMERDVLAAAIPETYAFRPALITGNRQELRLGEGLAVGFFKLINPFIPEAYQSIPAETIAKAMVAVANGIKPKGVAIPSEEIRKIGLEKGA
jgi:uncharacterized protein YbjT (DUF2867 family)